MGVSRLTSLVLASALLAALPGPREAAGQGDWSVERDPFDRRLVARYKQLLAKDPTDASALARLVSLYKRYRSLVTLIEEYEAEFTRAPGAAAAVVLGHLHREAGDNARALAMYERAVQLDATSSAVHAALGELYRAASDDARARAAYDAALPLARGNEQRRAILQVLADLALGADDIEAAQGYYDQAIALAPDDVSLRVAMADALSRHRLHERAIKALEDAEKRLRTDPARRVDVVARIGAAREALGEDDAAVREYRRAIDLTKRGYYLRRQLTDRIVDIYRKRQDLPGLVEHYQRTWPAARRDHMEWDVLARLYEETGDQEQAVAAFRRAVAASPFELDTQRRLLALLENSGRDAEAIRQYEAVIRVAPGEPRFQIELAQRYWRAQDPKRALGLLAKVERRFSHDPGVQLAVANLYSEWGREDQSLAVHVRLTKIEPSEPEHLVALGEQYFQRGDRDKALATWKRIAAGKSPAGFGRLADVYAEHDMPDEALAMYTRAIKAEPEEPARYRGRARIYERKRLYDRAVEDWQRVLELTPSKASEQPARREARRRIVSLLRKTSREYQRAKSEWIDAFYAQPPDVEAGYLLVEAYLKDDDPERAANVLGKLLEARPDDREAMQMLVKVYRAEERYDDAIALLEQLAEQSPGREREYYTEIAELKRLGRKDSEAILYAKKALENSPNDAVAWAELADTYEKMERVDEAVAAYKRTLALAPRNFDVHFSLAAIYERTGQLAAAAELYRQALQDATDDQVLERAGDAAIALEEYDGTLGELERVVAPLAFTFTHKPIYRSILVELYDRYVPRLVAQQKSEDPAEVEAARAELERVGAHGLKPLLEALADEEDPAQRRIAVTVLGHVGNRGAAVPLVKLATAPAAARRRVGTLQATEELDMRTEALVAAGRLGDPRIIPELTALLDHREVAMREAAAFALGVTGDRAAVRPLVRALEDSRDSVQVGACFALARIGDPSARTALASVAANEDGEELPRAACAFALGYLGDAAAAPILIALLRGGNGEPQRAAAWALGRLGATAAVPALLEAYFTKLPRVREAVVWALPRAAAGKAGDEPMRGLEEFPMLGDGGGRHYDAREAVALAVGAIAPTVPPADLVAGYQAETIAALRAALGARNASVALRALADLDARDDGLALGALTAGLADAKAARREAADAALTAVGAAIMPELTALASHDDSEIRQRVVSVAAKTGRAPAGALVGRGLSDERSEVRQAALSAAARFAAAGGPDASALAHPVAALLGADTWPERRVAATALRAFGAAAPTDALVGALGDGNSFVREQAARSLGALAREDAVVALIGTTRDAMPYVRLAAVRALVAIGGPRATARLDQITADASEPDEIRAAASAR